MPDERANAKDCRRSSLATNALPRWVRLTEKRTIDHVFSATKVRRVFGPLVILGTPNELEYARIGFAVSKRYAPKAVCRNTIKRVAREWFRRNRHALPSYDYMVLLRSRVKEPHLLRQRLTAATKVLQTNH